VRGLEGAKELTIEDALWDLLSRATVRIADSANQVCGSGFFIEPGLVLTAAHVVAEIEGPLSLVLHDGRKCQIVNTVEALPRQRLPGRPVWPLPDVAILSVEDEWLDQNIPFVEMSEQVPAGEVLIAGVTRGITGAMADDRARLIFEATRKEGETTLLKLSGNSLEPGMSGGPVLDPASSRVVGMVKADRDDGAFVVAGNSIAAALPARWASHLEAHQRDPRWRLEAGRSKYAAIGPAVLEQYLEGLSTEYRGSPMLPAGLDRAQISQPTRVRPQRSIGTQIEASNQRLKDENADSVSGEAFLWDPLRSPWASVAIIAGPGMGKTWLLTNHAVTIGQQSFDRIRENPGVHVDVPLPVVVNAAAFARRLDADPNLGQVTEALSATILRGIGQRLDPAQLAPMLELALEDVRVVLCVDGVDEVPDDLRERLLAALAILEPLLSQLVVSGRESARPALERVFGGGEYEEFSIAGFALGDVRRFVRSWHRDRPELVGKVEEALRESPGLRTLMHVPLLLSFVCRLAAEGHTLSSTRSGLYYAVALNVLSGHWRGPQPAQTDPVVRLSILADAVGPLAATWRSRPDEFSEHDVEMALRSQPGYDVVRDAALRRWRFAEGNLDRGDGPEPTAPVVWELLHDGLLTRAQGPKGEQLLRFSHLVFGELCVAMWLAQLEVEEQAMQVEQHRWFDRHWEDIIPISCGVADDPSALLSRLAAIDDDPWLTQAQLLANCMVEVPAAADRGLVESLVSTLVRRLSSGPASDAQAARGALTTLLTGHVEHADRRLVAALQNRELPVPHKGFAMRLLCQVGEAYAVAKCKEIVSNPNVPRSEREEAAVALCGSGDQSAVEAVIESFSTQRSTYQDLAVALAQGDTSSQAALDLVQRRDVDQGLRVAVAVEQLQSNGIEAAAQELVVDPSLGLAGQVTLTVALLRAGQYVDSAQANELVENPNLTRESRLELVHTLLLRGEFAALPAAADLVVDIDIDYRRRRLLAQTMFSVGTEGARTLYLSAIRSRVKPEARLQALLVLIERRHAEGCRAASAIVANGEGERWVSAQLLGALLAHVPSTVDQEAVVAMLADRDLSEGGWHMAWEDLAVMMLRLGATDLRTPVAERIKRRLEDGNEEPSDLAAIDVSRLLSSLATSGGNGLDLLVGIASDRSATVDARVRAAMSAALGDVTRVEELQQILGDPQLPEPILQRLAVAFAMLGASQVLTQMFDMLPASEPAYVALRAILQSESVNLEIVSDGVRRGREAVRILCDAEPITWDLDFVDLASQMNLEARSDTERKWLIDRAADKLRDRTYARLLSLLLPTERVALYRVGGFVDSKVTRDWLATWIPAYRDVAQAEAAQLQERIDAGREALPAMRPGVSMSQFEGLAQTALLLGEWWGAIERRDWATAMRVLAANHELFESPLMHNANLASSSIAPGWPDAEARMFLLWTVTQENGIDRVLKLLTSYGTALNDARHHLGAENAELAFGATSVAALLWPTDAAGFFYAAESMLALKEVEQAKKLMSESAARATGRQAAQGRKTLLEFGQRHGVSPDLVEEMRDILGSALEGQEFVGEETEGIEPDSSAADNEDDENQNEDAI
jgi:hypothetical protein